MHISEGVLTAPVLGAGAILTVAGLAIGLKKMDYEKLPEVAVLSSVFFVASLIHVPIGPSAAHLILNGICGLLLGWLAFPAIFVGLTLQAILFEFGGLTTLGINTFNMAFPAVILGYACRRFIKSPQTAVRAVAEFLTGAGAVLLSGFMVAVSLVLALGESIDTAAKLIVVAHIPVMILEGIITIFIIEFIRKVRPEML
ncbi:cobalt transporter CbiM [Desulfomonile tiedjei]|uniref:ABC-type Co2+ transport system, permease component n=1 Tax=Desulfomonile tiedjei (strain ATCC 49306 / DSM 6799 / DCB-1) TaxID=706587 RepID=I4C1I3_DESTA|nr:cobalt transporter CbiM [Desulfomonile tiedjei]AFM23424.1 ABC-type Co2+ transport system, permease component [Desulfomonile tiedjei DSM 6799]